MQKAALILTRLDCVLLARNSIDDVDSDACLANTIAQFRREIPLDLLSRQSADSIEERRNPDLRAALAQQHPLGRNGIARITLAHHHLISALIRSGRRHG